MVDQLKGLFGGGSKDDDNEDAKVAKLKDFAARYKEGDPNDGYDEDEAKANLHEVLKKASPEQIQAAARKTFDNLPEGQRKELAEMIEARKKGEGLVHIQRTGDGSTSTGSNADATSSDGNPLGDLFGGLLGGGGGGGDLGGLLGGLLDGSSGGSSGGGGGGLGGLLGGLLGGGSKSQSTDNSVTQSGGGGLDDLLGSILSGPQGKAILGGIAAFAADAMSNDKK